MKKVSVIVPVYNAEKYIDQCMQSLVQQTIGIEAMEIILVNDASTDNTYEKLLHWEKQYSESVMVINCAQNGKQGMARNIGLQYATGQYVGFVDDDDYISLNMYENMYIGGVEQKADLVVANSVKQFDYEEIPQNSENICEPEFIEIKNQADRLKFLKRDINIAIWNKIYKTSFLKENEIVFLPGYIYDDIYFSGLVKSYAKRILITQQIMYYHIIRESSVSYGNKNKSDRIGYMEVQLTLLEELKNRGLLYMHESYYKEELIYDYIGFRSNYEKSFGVMQNELCEIFEKAMLLIFPDLGNLPLIKKIIENPEKSKYYKYLKFLVQ